jgi:hypothetical protein
VIMANPNSIPFYAPSLLPSASDTALKHHFLGRQLKDVQAPAVVIDAAVVRRNCKMMLDTAKELGVGFRAHVKTHKVWSVGSTTRLLHIASCDIS